jgi:two-component system, CitB family, response regulator DctR
VSSAPTATVRLADWRVMIVEDNPAVAALHRRIVDAVPYLHTAHIAPNGEQAFVALRTVRPELVILDLTMRGGDGMSFMRRLRAEGAPTDVIVVTASRGGDIVDEATRLGVIEYLVKPFAPERLQRALATFAMRRRALTRSAELSQADVDTARGLPDGLRESTHTAVLALLAARAGPLDADEVGEGVGVARVTARRYLEHLRVLGTVELVRRLDGPGRPRNLYRLTEGTR